MTERIRPHVPVVMRDQDGSFYVVCYACTGEASEGQPALVEIIECRKPELQPPGIEWPPFLLTEAPHEQPFNVDQLNALFDPDTNEHTLRDDVMKVIEHHIVNRPRSLQREIGPSEIGHECHRYIAYKLADVDTINPASKLVAWRPQIGVMAHNGLEQIFTMANELRAQYQLTPRWVTEKRLKVGEMPALAGDGVEEIYGSGDLYDAVTASVLDWKVVGPTTLKSVKAVPRGEFKPRGASRKYRIQGQAYGIGYSLLGLRVRWIVIAYLPAAGELHEAYFHVEPYQPELAQTAMQRLSATRQLINSMPLSQVLELTPTADAFCQKCPFFDDFSENLATGGCPGHAGRKVRQSSLMKLLPPAQSEELTVTDADMPISNRR